MRSRWTCLAVAVALAVAGRSHAQACDSALVAMVRANLDSIKFTTTGTPRSPAYLQRAAGRIDVGVSRACLPPVPAPKPNQLPVASFTFHCTPSPGNERRCAFESNSSDADGQITALVWTSPGKPDRSGPSAVWGFNLGTYSVTLKVTDDSGATAQTTQAIVVGGSEEPADSTVRSVEVGFILTTSTLWPAGIGGFAQDSVTVCAEVDGGGGVWHLGQPAVAAVYHAVDSVSFRERVELSPAELRQACAPNWTRGAIDKAMLWPVRWTAYRFGTFTAALPAAAPVVP